MKKSTVMNIIFALVILIVAGALAVFYAVQHNAADAPETYAELTYGPNNTVMNIPLDEDKIYNVDTGYYTIHLEVKDGKIRFFDSPCPDHQCEGFGWISQDFEFAACMPAHAVVMIQTVDAE